MDVADFTNAWLRIKAARERVKTLQAELIAWNQANKDSTRGKCNADGSRYSIGCNMQVRPDMDRLGQLFGDCIQDLRSALDSWVYALAVRNTGVDPPPKVRSIQFPITISPETFQNERYRIASLRAGEQTFIERVQPYNRRHPQVPPLLGMLNEFNNRYKHRKMIALTQHVEIGEFKFLDPFVPGVSPPYFPRTPFVDGNEVAFFDVSPPSLHVYYKCSATIHITVPHAHGPNGDGATPILTVLRSLVEETEYIVNGMA